MEVSCSSCSEIDLNGRILNVAAVDNFPFFGMSQNKTLSGIDVSVLETLAGIFNFSFRVCEPKDSKWGGPQPDGTVSGIIGMVANHEADLAIDEITISDKRLRVVDFSHPYYFEPSIILSKAPQSGTYVWAIFSPFPQAIWLTLALCIPLYGILLWFVRGYLVKNEPGRRYSVDRFIHKTFKVMTSQGSLMPTSSSTIRCLLCGWYIFTIIINALYSGILTAVLASPLVEDPIDSLDDLAQSRHITPIVTASSAIQELLETSTSGIYKNIYSKFSAESYLKSVDDGVKKVLNGKFALIEASLSATIRAKVINKNLFHFSKQEFYHQFYAIAYPKGSPLRNLFNPYLRRFVEVGLIEKWTTDKIIEIDSARKWNHGDHSHAILQAINLTHLRGAFILYAVGIVFATAVYLAEVCNKRNCIRILKLRYPG